MGWVNWALKPILGGGGSSSGSAASFSGVTIPVGRGAGEEIKVEEEGGGDASVEVLQPEATPENTNSR
jgi:hypothetical protein